MPFTLAIAEFLIKLIEEFGLFGIFITMSLESCGFPIPSEIIMPFAGFVSWKEKNFLLFFEILITATIANLFGSILLYFIGKNLGRRFLLNYGKYILLTKEKILFVERWFMKNGEKAIFIGRMLPAIRTVISFPAGVAKMNKTKFLIFTFLGSLPWNLFLLLLGFWLNENWNLVIAYSPLFDFLAIFIFLIFCVYFVFKLKSK
jgi:membrane protein DedA with SNARE-associated domain